MDDATSTRFDVIGLTDCDREPIHLAVSIQPHGCLFVVDRTTMRIVQCAGDTGAMLDVPEPLGATLADLLGNDAAERLAACDLRPRGLSQPGRGCEADLATTRGRFDAVLHDQGNLRIVELEPGLRATPDALRTPLLAVQRMATALDLARPLPDFLQACALQLRDFTGFDRVMVYRFEPDGSGVVIAEARDDAVESFLGLHYPESDIPKQARELYRRNWIRFIPDVEYRPAPLRPRLVPGSDEPLDLGFAGLRSVSPIHVQYLRNMSVGASLSISLLRGDRLWGLVACHHRTSRMLAWETRTACELFGQMMSLQLDARLQAEGYEARLEARSVHQHIVARLVADENLTRGLVEREPGLLDLVKADGVAVWTDGSFAEFGRTPGRAAVQALVRQLNRREPPGLFATDRLAQAIPELRLDPSVAAGLLALSISRNPRDYVLWFRAEVLQSVTWAGNPHKAVQRTDGAAQLSPRASFAAWRETVRGRSLPWTEVEIDAARELRLAISETVLRRIDEIARERAEANARQSVLLAELDHRVKNTLAQIQALMRRTRPDSGSIDEYIEALERRVQSMAHAQGLLSESRWRGAELRRLLDDELRQFESASGAVVVEGARVELVPRAALTLSLVLHELATNAGKYGALSVPHGRLHVSWRREAGRLCLSWRESGGPTVAPPRRRGFGRTLIETSVAYELKGEVSLRFLPEGVACDLAIPLDHVLDADATQAKPAMQDSAPAPSETKRTVLVVEDSLLTALDIASTLEELGYAVRGPASRVDQAMLLIEQGVPDGAVLDINLGDATSFPIAERLAEAGRPFLFLSGYDPRSVLPARFLHVPCVTKPFSDATLRAALGRLFGGAIGA